ncbi:hypothetical protein VF21_02504 [Pseudogymnoascus sp. 05NY08]|nr:hypothetical protein VF21_02504 [Pseudogymnoascus sp. 05NY08]
MINGIVSELHRLNGYEVQPPYIRDHVHGPISYRSPRGLKIAVPKEAAGNEAEEEEVQIKVAEVKEAEEKVEIEVVEVKEAEEKVSDEAGVKLEVAEVKEAEEKVSGGAEVEMEVAEEKEPKEKVSKEKVSDEAAESEFQHK